MVSLPLRLQKVADLIPTMQTVADIGTDHALLPIYLVQSGRSQKVIAVDVNRGPYETARGRVKALGLEDRIDVRLGDGTAVLRPHEASVLVAAGIGGRSLVGIFERDCGVINTLNYLVLNPMTHLQLVRKWLIENGWLFVDEDLVFEQGRYYQVIAAKPGTNQDKFLTPLELQIGPVLLKKRHPLLKEYLASLLKRYSRAVNSMKRSSDQDVHDKVKRLNNLMEAIDSFLNAYTE